MPQRLIHIVMDHDDILLTVSGDGRTGITAGWVTNRRWSSKRDYTTPSTFPMYFPKRSSSFSIIYVREKNWNKQANEKKGAGHAV